MKVYDRVHQLRTQFSVTLEIARHVYVYIIMGKEGCYLVDTGVKGCDRKIKEYVHKFGENRRNINAVPLTHSHPGHIGALKSIREGTPAVYMSVRGRGTGLKT